MPISHALLYLVGILVAILLVRNALTSPNVELTRCDEYCEQSDECRVVDATMLIDSGAHAILDIVQPVNAWTNMSFLVFGFWPFIMDRMDMATGVFLLGNSYLCIGSFMFHATMSRAWADVDVGGMITLLLILVVHGLFAVVRHFKWKWWSVLLIMALGFVFPLYKDEMDAVGLYATNLLLSFMSMFGLLHIILLARTVYERDLCRFSSRGKVLDCIKAVVIAATPAGLFAAAVLLRTFDRNKKWCEPTSVLQGHGAWHCLTALAIYVIWRFFDSQGGEDSVHTCSQHKDIENDNGVVTPSPEHSPKNVAKEADGIEAGLGLDEAQVY